MNRRNILKLSGSALLSSPILLAATGCCQPSKKEGTQTSKDISSIQFDNDFFYDANGKFDEEKGKDAIMALIEYHGYPVYPDMRKSLWVSDYNTGKFTEVGLAARMWENNIKDHYMLMDLFLLPNQMLPEHWHLEGEQDGIKVPAKLEGWLVRYGASHIGGEGEENMTIQVPKSHNDGKVTVKHEVLCQAGEFARLNRVLAHHWQFGIRHFCMNW